ncbi:MAG: hypothetical protein QOI42_851, partial [Frankiaceae bacterium]|nr:hypothetical protein [Frankiaceae bacterium]
MEAALVVHLVAPDAPVVGSGWDAPDGSVRHIAASWREMPPSVVDAAVVIAHGVPALLVAQLIADVLPHLVYRPTDASTLRRGRGRRRLRASWVASPDKRTGRRAARALGLGKNRVIEVRDAERADWNALVRVVMQHRADTADDTQAGDITVDDITVDDITVDDTADDLIPGTGHRFVQRSSRVAKWTLSRFAPSQPPGAARAVLPPPPPPPALPAPEHEGEAAAPEPATVPFPGGRLPEPEPSDSRPVAAPPNIIAAQRGAWPATLDVGVADPTSPGHPWWKYRRMDVPGQPPGPPRGG